MSVLNIHLRKLLRIMYLDSAQKISALRSDIREDIAREAGDSSGGGDFYGPFWRDAKDHVFGLADLHASVRARIESNPRRANLYPQLRDGFLVWWNERRRWTNEPFEPASAPRARFIFDDLGATVKIDNIMSVSDARLDDHYIYPYFAPAPVLSDEAARLGLWLIREATSEIHIDDVRILDVIRGRTFSNDKTPFIGNEENVFREKYSTLIDQWNGLRLEY